jgi:ribose-phosphate pyrophosphokinase
MITQVLEGERMTAIVFALPGNEDLARGICRAGGWERGEWTIRRFPDGETYVRYRSAVAERDVVLVCSLADPDAKAVALYLAASVARELGARRVGLLAPYLAYMRQDTRFQPGEGVTARHFACLLSGAVDWLVTVDPHLHRIHRLDALYGIPSTVVQAAPALAGWVAANIARPVLVGPDEESEQWVAGAAAAAGCPYVVLRKQRSGDRAVAVTLPRIAPWRDRTAVLVDDIASTARTMMAAAARIREAGMAPPWCLAVHPLFAGRAYEELLACGVAGVASTNCVPHPSNRIDMAPPLAAALAGQLALPSKKRHSESDQDRCCLPGASHEEQSAPPVPARHS